MRTSWKTWPISTFLALGRSFWCEAFPAAEARRLVERFEWHYTPKHGSWLDLAESELGVLSSQCLDHRIPDKQTLVEEVAAWEFDRNANHSKANWHFTTQNARINLKHLYPSIGMNLATMNCSKRTWQSRLPLVERSTQFAFHAQPVHFARRCHRH